MRSSATRPSSDRDDFAKLNGAHARLLAAIATGDAAADGSALKECRGLGGAPLAQLYDSYERQLDEQGAAAASA